MTSSTRIQGSAQDVKWYRKYEVLTNLPNASFDIYSEKGRHYPRI